MPVSGEGLDRLTLTTQLIDEATTPLLKLKRTTAEVVDTLVVLGKKAQTGLSGVGTGIMTALGHAGTGIMNIGRRIGDAFAAMGREAAAFGKATAQAAGLAAGALMVKGITYAQEVISKGYERVITMQDATAASAVLMGGDVAKATKFMEDIRAVVTGTPFTLPDFAKAGQQMLMYGIGAEKIPGILTAIGEATAGQGSRAVELAARMGDTIAKMAATGQVQLGDMWSMAEAGVPALNILANGFGVTTEEMKDMISSGLVPSQKAIDILTKGIMEGTNGVAGATASYAGSMKELGKTWSGALSIFEASKGRLGEAYIAPLKESMPGILTAMTGVNNSLQVFAPMWKGWLESSGVLPWIAETLNKISTSIKEFGTGGGLTTFMEKLKEFAPILGPAAGALLGIFSGLAANIPIIGQFLPVLSPITGILLGLIAVSPQLRATLGEVFLEIFQILSNNFVPVLRELWAAFQPVIPVIIQLAQILIQSLVPILRPIIVGLSEVVRIVGGWLVEALATLVPHLTGFVVILIQKLTPILPILMAALVSVLEAFTPLIPVIIDLAIILLDLAAMVLTQLLDAIMPLIPPVIELIRLFIDMAVKAILPILPIIMELITLIVRTTLEAILPILPQLMEFITLVLKLAMSIGMELITIIVDLMPVLLELFKAIVPILPPVLELIGLLLKLAIEVITPLIPLIVQIAGFMGEYLQKAIELVIPWVRDLIDAFRDMVTWIVDRVTPALSTIGGMFQGIFGFIGDVSRAVKDFFDGAFGWIADFFKSISGAAGGGIVVPVGFSGGGIAHFGAGGVLGGYSPGQDTVPAMLSPGEAVLVPELVRALGANNIMAANWEYSHRPAMGGQRGSTGGGLGGTTIHAPIQIDVHAGPDGSVDLAQLEAALEAILGRAQKRSY